MDTALLIVGCSVFVMLGLGHAALAVFTRKFEPRDRDLFERLKSSHAGLTKQGSMWKGIKGFHLSHSLGMAIFGGFYITLVVENNSYLKSSTALNVGLFLVPVVYAFLAHRYWFSIPRNCFVIATGLLLSSAFYR